MTRYILLLLISAVLLGDAQYTVVGSGPTLPPICRVGNAFIKSSTNSGIYYCDPDDIYTLIGSGGGVPAGSILLIVSGTCPAGFVEETTLNGKFLLGTLAASGDVGTTGGADNIIPTGTVSAPTFTGNVSTAIVNHTHGLSFARGATTGGATTTQGFTSASDTSSTAITDVTNNPGGGVANYTPVGTNSAPVFTGTQFSNRPAWLKVIFCRKS